MMVSNALPDLTITSVKVFWRGLSSVLASNSAMPSTPFIGVRISWLILARNSDLARSAASALTSSALHSSKARWIATSIGRNTHTPTTPSTTRIAPLAQASSLSLNASASRRSFSIAVRARTSIGCANNSFWLWISRGLHSSIFCAPAMTPRLRTMSRADQNRSPLTEVASISSEVGLESFGLTAASAPCSTSISACRRSAWPRADAPSSSFVAADQMWVVCSAKLAAFFRSRVSSTIAALSRSRLWR